MLYCDVCIMQNEKNPREATQYFLDIDEVNQRILKLSLATGYDCIQRNGQRHYGPPPYWTGPSPEKGSEVFLGRLPRDCFEDEIVPLFETVAPIYEVRLMLNFTGFNRGFAFVTYCNSRDAWKAVLMLHDYEIRPGHKIGVSKSIDNCRLYVGNIPLEKTKEEAWRELNKFVSNMKNLIIYPSVTDPKKNRGFMFIEFDCHRSAAMAKRQMVPGTVQLWGQNVIVDWADPEPDVDPTVMGSVTKLFVRNLNKNMDNDKLRTILGTVLPPESISKVHVAGYYAFIHFNSRVCAQIAKEKLTGMIIEGQKVEVQWARPRTFKKQTPLATHCKSLPPRLRNTNKVLQVPPDMYVPY